jgi:hypothetical protein
MPIPKNSTLRPTEDRPKSASPFDVRPPPTLSATFSTGRKGGQAALVTSSPSKKRLEESRPNPLRHQSQNRTYVQLEHQLPKLIG